MANELQIARRDGGNSLAAMDPRDFMRLSPVETLARMSRLMDSFFGDTPGIAGLPVDLTESDGAYVLTMEVPGVRKEDLTIECRNNTIYVRGEKRNQRNEDNERAYLIERTYGVFSRAIELPDDANLDRIEASFRDGVLHVSIEKRPEAQPKRIEIQG